jgi:deoxyribose-phosphate aldolase
MERPTTPLDVATFTSLVDHTLLKATATSDQIESLCAEAVEFSTAAVCVNGGWVAAVHRALQGSGVSTCSVVGFPLGAMATGALTHETEIAVADGADEVDMVLPVGALLAGDDATVAGRIASVREAAGARVLKVILETALLDDEQIVRACRISVDSGADFVKTSTGFDPAGGATVDDVRLMRATVGPDIGVKASGGIRTLADVEAMVDAGATRLGMSATRSVVDELKRASGVADDGG